MKDDLVWLILRARLGRDHAISTDAIAAICDCTLGEAKREIKTLRGAGIRIAYSARKPQGYYIPTPADDLDNDDTLRASLSAVVALIIRQALTRRICFGDLMREVSQMVAGELVGPLAPLQHALPAPASDAQVVHLSHLVLSSEVDDDDADEIYRLIASLGLSKKSAGGHISDLRDRIDEREKRRIDSKRRRMDRQGVYHPGQPAEALIRRDEYRVRGVWKKAQADNEEGE